MRPPSAPRVGSSEKLCAAEQGLREVRAYLAKLLLAIAVGIVIMAAAATAAWRFYGPSAPEVIRPAPVVPYSRVPAPPPGESSVP